MRLLCIAYIWVEKATSLTNEANKFMMNSKINHDYPFNPYPSYHKSHNGSLMAEGVDISYKFLMMMCPLSYLVMDLTLKDYL